MKKYPDEDIEKARTLREREHYSFAHLQRLTGIPATTIRNWCSDIVIGTKWDTLLKTKEREREMLRISEASIIDSFQEITPFDAKMFAALLYWCEGYKYPASNRVGFTNSDPSLLKVFITLLRKGFNLDENKFKAHLQIHDTQNYESLREFWSNLLSIPEAQFIKPTITKKRGGKHRKVYLGTCTVKYIDFRLQLKLIGIYEAFVKKFGEVA